MKMIVGMHAGPAVAFVGNTASDFSEKVRNDKSAMLLTAEHARNRQ